MLREEDKRHFKRYTSQSECELRFSSDSADDVMVKGIVSDYSDGIGVVIENVPDFVQGTEVNVRIIDQDLTFKGEAAWVVKTGNSLKAGIRRTESFTGDLRFFRLADILIGLNRSAKTGILEITSGSTVKKVFIDKGDMIFSSSNNKDDRLGEHLLKKGKITLTEYEQASHLLRKTGQKLGKILVELGYLTPKELFQEVRRQIEEIIISLFILEEGKFEFKEETLSAGETIILKISTADIIYHGIKRINNFMLIKQMCPSINDILNSSHNPVRIFQSLNLESADKKILSHINGLYTLARILSLSPSSNFEALKTISALMSIGLIHVKGEDEAPAELPLEEILGQKEDEAPQEYLQKLEDLYNKCKTQGYYEVLGVAENAPTEYIERAYFRLSKQFHPDRHLSFPSHNIKEKLLKITSYTTEAYEILSNSEKRRAYNKRLIVKDEDVTVAAQTSSAPAEQRGIESPESAIEAEGNGVEPIELPEEILAAAGGEEPAVAERDEEDKQDAPVYDLNAGGLEDSARDVQVNRAPDIGEGEPAEETKESAGEAEGSGVEPIELPEERVAAGGGEETAVTERDEEDKQDAPVYDLNAGGLEDSARDMQVNRAPDIGEGEPAEVTRESAGEAEGSGVEPIELPEEILAAAGGEEPAVAERDEEDKQDAPVYDLNAGGLEDSARDMQVNRAPDIGEGEPAEVTRESAGKAEGSGVEPIELPEEILAAGGGEEPAVAERDEEDKQDAPVYDLNAGGLEDSARDMQVNRAPDIGEGEPAEVTRESAGKAEGSGVEPIELPEERVAAAGREETDTADTKAIKEEEPVPFDDSEMEALTETDEEEIDLVTADHASVPEKGRFNKKWAYVPLALVGIILLVLAIPLVTDTVKIPFFHSAPEVSHVMDVPSVRDNAFEKERGQERGGRLASFRDEAFDKFLRE